MVYARDHTPDEQYAEAMQYITEIQDLRKERPDLAAETTAAALTADMSRAIFGSNFIERAGWGLDETLEICEAIFKGQDAEIEE